MFTKKLPSFFKPDPKKGWTLRAMARAGGAGVLIVGGTIIVLSIIGTTWTALTGERFGTGTSMSYAPAYDTGYYDEAVVYNKAVPTAAPQAMGARGMIAEMAFVADSDYAIEYYEEDGGDFAEEFERTSYYARIETPQLERTCDAIAGLKPLDYVLFDEASESERNCSYEFRVAEEQADEVADAIRALHPTDFSVTTASVGSELENTEARRARLERRLVSLEKTLAEAEGAFETLFESAVSRGSVSELTAVVNSRIATTERLTREMQSIEEQLVRIDAQEVDTLEDTLYQHFSVHVQKRTYIDTETIGNQWRSQLEDFTRLVNQVVLWLTLGLAGFLLQAGVLIVFMSISIIGLIVVGRYLRASIVALVHTKKK